MRVLEQLYLIQRVRPWFRTELSRLVKTPKLHFIDPGLLRAMRGYSLSRLRAWTEERVMLFHYRDRDKLEVDFVLENSAGEIVGIEVKSAASVTRRDFLGLERVASAAGSAFKQGIVLYDGAQRSRSQTIFAPFPYQRYGPNG